MARLLLHRAWQSGVVLFIIITLVFFLARITGSAENVLVPLTATPAQREQVRDDLGLNEPLYSQYGLFLGRVLKGDLGKSFVHGKSVTDLFWERFPATLHLTGVAMGLVVLLGIPLGIIGALTRGSPGDTIVRWFVAISQASPPFWLAFVLIAIFGVQLGWLPFVGRQEPTSVILPAVAISLYPMAGVARLTRSGMIEALGQEYIFFARAKGMPGWSVVLKHALRNALIPVVTFSGVVLVSHFLVGSVLVEVVHGWPGVGLLAWNSALNRDYATLQGLVLIFATMFIIANLVVDMSYAALDPRIRRLSSAA